MGIVPKHAECFLGTIALVLRKIFIHSTSTLCVNCTGANPVSLRIYSGQCGVVHLIKNDFSVTFFSHVNSGANVLEK